MSPWRLGGCLASIAGAAALPACGAPKPIHPLELARAFGARSPWRLVMTEGPATIDFGDNPAPGELHLCLEKTPAGPCVGEPVTAAERSDDWAPHYLRLARLVYPQGRAAPPLLQIVTASLNAGDGDQIVVTQLLKYSRATDAFSRVLLRRTGTNNNQEVRFVTDGPLRGDVISAEPTGDAPFGYWIEVRSMDSARRYRRVLRYRSATHYSDGNALAVIDSEAPNLERRLGLWKAGGAPPRPLDRTKPCPRPRLRHMELWCA